jgi:hypothetical protein
MDIKETGEERVDWINLAHNVDNRWGLVNIATILRVSIKRQFPEQLRDSVCWQGMVRLG